MKTYKYSFNQEDILSFIPSLFPYIEWNSKDECVLRHATDNHNGSYGKIVPKMRLGDGRIFSYNELVTNYLKHNDETITAYVDKAVGKIEIDKSLFPSDISLLPDYVYLSKVKELYTEYVNLKTICEQGYIDDKAQLCCLREKYRNMGGDTMTELLKGMLPKANELSNEYYRYAVLDGTETLKINLSIPLSQSIDDIGYLDSPIEEWVAGKKYYKGDCVIYLNDVYRCKSTNGNSGKYNEETEGIDFNYDMWEKATDGDDASRNINGTTDSKLKSLRRYTEYLNADDETETPSYGEDWLFFYRKGYVANYRTVNDNYGNITHSGNDYKNGNDLMAYGDVLIDITCDGTNRLITFKYAIDCHLKATYQKSETDDDGNVKYLFSDFSYDDSDKLHGVIYTDVYSYTEGSDVDKLILSGGFDDYVNDGSLNNDDLNMFTKFEFNSLYSSTVSEIDCTDTKVPVVSILSTFDSSYRNDTLNVPTVRRDYLNGISYAPEKDIDVSINRGNTSAMEKHIKFSEVKTLEDMELFTNGGFFIMKEDS